jgi:hypothetical protein
MSERLYVVTVEYETVVYASSEEEAEQLAEDNASDDLSCIRPRMLAAQVSDVKDLPPEWPNAIPWGWTKDDSTCRDILAAIGGDDE